MTADADVGQDNAPGDDENDKLARHDPHAASAGPGMCQPAWAEDKLERHLQVNTEHVRMSELVQMCLSSAVNIIKC